MSWLGYYSYDGTEIVNVARTQTYVRNSGITWLKELYDEESLSLMLGDGEFYNTPLLDDAPWIDPDQPESFGFYGFYPIDVDGVQNSTRSSTVVESVNDGAVPGRIRHGSKTIVFNGLLIAEDEAAAEYGMRWLKIATLGAPCGNVAGCSGSDLCYLASEPRLDLNDVSAPFFDPTECLTPLLRTLKRVVINNGPKIITQKEMSDGSQMWNVTFTAVAGKPWEFGAIKPIIAGFMDPAVTDPFVPGITGGTYDLDGLITSEEDCPVSQWDPLYDPLCPAMIVPPAPPDIALGCYVPPVNWHRRQITIPRQYIPLWGDVVPVVEVHAQEEDLRNLRLRFYADVTGSGDPNVDNCAYCGDIVISYVPLNTTLIFDGVTETVVVQDPGGHERSADSLVFRTDGKPFDWPSLSCGFGYIVTFDLPQTQAVPSVDLSLVSRVV